MTSRILRVWAAMVSNLALRGHTVQTRHLAAIQGKRQYPPSTVDLDGNRQMKMSQQSKSRKF